MTKDEAKEKFKLADRLFAEEKFGPALKVLTELNASFPNERHILYPMARSLTGLGRISEALDVTDRVVRQFGYGPAVDLYKRLKEMKTGGGLAALESQSDPPGLPPGAMKFDSDPIELPGGLPKFDSDLPSLPSELGATVNPLPRPGALPPPLSTAAGPPWHALLLWIGLAVICFAAVAATEIVVKKPTQEWLDHVRKFQGTRITAAEVFEGFPRGPVSIYLTILSIAAYVYSCFPTYWALRVMNKLPFNDFGEDMKDVALWTLLGFLILPIIVAGCVLSFWTLGGLLLFPLAFIGWIVFIVRMRRHYDLSFGELVGVVMLSLAFSLALSVVVAIPYEILTRALLPA